MKDHIHRKRTRPRRISGLACALIACGPFAHGAILVDQPTSTWTPVVYPGVQSDYAEDVQASGVEGDIVGSASYPAFFVKFDKGGTPDQRLDGDLAFRIRLGGAKGKGSDVSFSAVALIGIDGNGDGALDLFVGVDKQGNKSELGIYRAGNSRNSSPATTKVDSQAIWSTPITTGNFLFSQVTFDTTAGDYDLNKGKKSTPDFFLSFQVPFAEVAAAMTSQLGSSFDDSMPVSYVAATSTQINKINQDINGVDGGLDQALTWSVLGGISPEINFDSAPVGVPEPRDGALLSSLGALVYLFCRRRARSR